MRTLPRLQLIVLTYAFIAGPATANAASLNPEEAVSYIGKNATVCGLIASGNYAAAFPTQPTF
jgi:hypothetical protein